MAEPVVGLGEIGAMLGVTRQRVAQLALEYEDFPEPMANLASGRVWATEAIEAWIAAHPDRPSGRPKRRRNHDA